MNFGLSFLSAAIEKGPADVPQAQALQNTRHCTVLPRWPPSNFLRSSRQLTDGDAPVIVLPPDVGEETKSKLKHLALLYEISNWNHTDHVRLQTDKPRLSHSVQKTKVAAGRRVQIPRRLRHVHVCGNIFYRWVGGSAVSSICGICGIDFFWHGQRITLKPSKQGVKSGLAQAGNCNGGVPLFAPRLARGSSRWV